MPKPLDIYTQRYSYCMECSSRQGSIAQAEPARQASLRDCLKAQIHVLEVSVLELDQPGEASLRIPECSFRPGGGVVVSLGTRKAAAIKGVASGTLAWNS